MMKNGSLIRNEKNVVPSTIFKQDIAISTPREDHIAFLQKKAIHMHIYPKAIKSIAIHRMSITSKVITSYLAYHSDQSIWKKHISTTYDTNAVSDTKMQTCRHDMIHK
jgi:hypothetical protein